MSHRTLIESFKFLTLTEMFLSAALVSHSWKLVSLRDEMILFFLDSTDREVNTSLSLYQQLKKQVLEATPRYLLHVANGSVRIWDLESNILNIETRSFFVNSARYTLDSRNTAVITGGLEAPRSCVRVNLVNGVITILPDLLEDRLWHGTAMLDNTVYISGGDISSKYLKSAEAFGGKQWARIADMTMERYNLTLSVYTNKIYAFGGSNTNGYEKSIEFYDGSIWTLAEIQLPTAQNYSSVIRYKRDLVLVGGFVPNASNRFTHVLEAGSKTWQKVCETKEVDYSLSNAIAVKNGKIYIFDHPPKQVVFEVNLEYRST